MRKHMRNVLLIGLITISTFAFGQSSTNDLNSTEPMMRGHIVALYLDHFFVIYGQIVDYSASILVSYNETDNIMELAIFGKQSTIDRAKKSTDSFRNKLLKPALNTLNEQFNLTLSENDFIIAYIYTKTNEKLLVFKNGNYTL